MSAFICFGIKITTFEDFKLIKKMKKKNKAQPIYLVRAERRCTLFEQGFKWNKDLIKAFNN